MNIYRKARPNTTIALLDKLEGKKEVIEVAYWRKFYELQDAIGDIIGEYIENYEDYELNKEHIEEIILWLQTNKDNGIINEWSREGVDNDIELLTKLIEKTNFDEYILFYRGDW